MVANTLKPLVEASRFMTIDMRIPEQGGILMYYTGKGLRKVDIAHFKTLSMEERESYIQQQLKPIIGVLEKEVEARIYLANKGYYLNPYNPKTPYYD